MAASNTVITCRLGPELEATQHDVGGAKRNFSLYGRINSGKRESQTEADNALAPDEARRQSGYVIAGRSTALLR